MSRFASKELQTIDLGDGEWVKIPVSLSYRTVMALGGLNEVDSSKAMLVTCIKEWNLKDENGIVPEVNEESILSLDIPTITQITKAITALVENNQDKKK